MPAGLVEAGEGGDVDTGPGLRGRGRPHAPGHHLVHDGLGVVTSEGNLPGVQLPQQDGQAVHVTPGAGRTAPEKLWSLASSRV